MKEEVIEIKAIRRVNDQNERVPTEFIVTVDGKIVIDECAQQVSVTALQGFFNRLI